MFNGEMFTPIFKLVQPAPFIYAVSLFLLGVGILVGMVGSARAVRKYLKI
jgi:cell division protein FtsX